jgi:hypothetical protein
MNHWSLPSVLHALKITKNEFFTVSRPSKTHQRQLKMCAIQSIQGVLDQLIADDAIQYGNEI